MKFSILSVAFLGYCYGMPIIGYTILDWARYMGKSCEYTYKSLCEWQFSMVRGYMVWSGRGLSVCVYVALVMDESWRSARNYAGWLFVCALPSHQVVVLSLLVADRVNIYTYIYIFPEYSTNKGAELFASLLRICGMWGRFCLITSRWDLIQQTVAKMQVILGLSSEGRFIIVSAL